MSEKQQNTLKTYSAAREQLQKQQKRNPRASWFNVCRDWNSELRDEVAQQFRRDGYGAQATDHEVFNCGGRELLRCVTVWRIEDTQ